jgi:hypothetical protein
MAASIYFHGKYGRVFGPLSFSIFNLLNTNKSFEKYDTTSKYLLMIVTTVIIFIIGVFVGLKKIFPYEEEQRRARNPRGGEGQIPSRPSSSSNLPIVNNNTSSSANNNNNNQSSNPNASSGSVGRNNRRLPRRMDNIANQGINSPLLQNNNEPKSIGNIIANNSATPGGVTVRRPIERKRTNSMASGESSGGANPSPVPNEDKSKQGAIPIVRNPRKPPIPLEDAKKPDVKPNVDIKLDVNPKPNLTPNSDNNNNLKPIPRRPAPRRNSSQANNKIDEAKKITTNITPNPTNNINNNQANNLNDSLENKAKLNPTNISPVKTGEEPKKEISTTPNMRRKVTRRITSEEAKKEEVKKEEKKDDKKDVKLDINPNPKPVEKKVEDLPVGDSLPKTNTLTMPVKPAYRRPVAKRGDSNNK